MATQLKKLNKTATVIFYDLIDGLEDVGEHKKFDNGGAGIMPVSVEIIGESVHGGIVSVTHYYEQNGDLMSDPDMTFCVCPDCEVIPLTFQQDNLGIYHRAVSFLEDGKMEVRRRMQADITSFANDWMRNIKEQQLTAVA